MNELIEGNRNILQAIGGHLAEIGLARAGAAPLGAIISPATWVYNYKTQGSAPSSVELAFWGVSLAGGIFAPVSLAVSYIKSLVDDDIQRKVIEARKTEKDSPYSPGILAVTGWGPPSSIAATFARSGGVAWQHDNGVWLSIVDGNGRLIPNFKPKKYRAIVRPVWPLKAAGDGYRITDKFY
jgi:hypothetical protein